MDDRYLIINRNWFFYYKEDKKNGIFIVLIASWGSTIWTISLAGNITVYRIDQFMILYDIGLILFIRIFVSAKML